MVVAAVLACAACLGPSAGAATFGVTPMRVDLGPAAPIGVVNINNGGERAITIQVRAYRWQQPDGTDTYEETRGLILSPPIFTLAPGETQLVRVAERAPRTGTTEQAYRLVVAEVPEADRAAESGVALRMVTRFNLPLYVAPAHGSAAPVAAFALQRDGTGAQLRVRNTGTGALRLASVSVAQQGRDLAHSDVIVVLPGATRAIELAAGALDAGQPVHVRAESNGGPVDLLLSAEPL